MDATPRWVPDAPVAPWPGLVCAQRSDAGRVRTGNEDSLEVDLERGLFVLADGMGGCVGGEVASSMAVRIVVNEFRQQPLPLPTDGAVSAGLGEGALRLATAIAKANREIHALSEARADLRGMGSTLVALLCEGTCAVIASIGDSRVYRLRQGRLEQLTVDHTVVQEQLEYGLLTPEQARLIGSRGLLTRALGAEPWVEVDVQEQRVLAGDVFLLCSDGLFDMLEDAEIRALLDSAATDLEGTAQRLVDAANARGGYDNISLILARRG